ncbi:ankyrin repeat domain-containing protein [Sphingobium olei]|uniref:Ankyrin repeat domain-containing protein n=1 Tax=Sphingobium olei TaxID=420955 RepID=A0ABW3P9C6_9SPHN|nr:ankyrin repeat domain-containing protein [Sphingobium sp.]
MTLMFWGSLAQAQGPLLDAIKANDVAGVTSALVTGADPNERLGFGATPLAWAVSRQNPDLVRALLAGGARPDTASADGVTPLALACELGDAGIVSQLLDAHADVGAARPDRVTPLAICARFGPADAVARMLAAGAPADKSDAMGQTPLMWAASSGRVEAIVPLIKAGADVNRVSKGGFTPLFFAIRKGSVPACEALLAAGAKADYRGPERTSALQLALYQHHYAAALLFVGQGGDLAERDREGRQPLHVAASGGDAALVAAMLAKGADVNGLTGSTSIKWVTEANFGVPPPPVPPTPPLLMAAAGGHAAVMRQLVDAGAKTDFIAADGTNILLAAAAGSNVEALDYALTLAPDANVADAAGATPLHVLLYGGPQPALEPMLRLLAAHGARTDIATKRGATAAQMAEKGLSEVKNIFLKIFPPPAATTLATAQK